MNSSLDCENPTAGHQYGGGGMDPPMGPLVPLDPGWRPGSAFGARVHAYQP